jgi:hypothetical protein
MSKRPEKWDVRHSTWFNHAGVAELADARDSKSLGPLSARAGSTPASGILSLWITIPRYALGLHKLLVISYFLCKKIASFILLDIVSIPRLMALKPKHPVSQCHQNPLWRSFLHKISDLIKLLVSTLSRQSVPVTISHVRDQY